MKILDTRGPRGVIVGKVCDRCARHIRITDYQSDDGRDAVCLGAEMARYVTVDIDHRSSLLRADLCEYCGNELLARMRDYLVDFRTIGAADARRGYRRQYRYRAIDAGTGQIFDVCSLFDDGA